MRAALLLLIPFFVFAPDSRGAASTGKVVYAQHAKTLSKITGSMDRNGQARRLNCTWTEENVTDGKQRCAFEDAAGATREIKDMRASFMIDTLTYSGAQSPRCVNGVCKFSGPHEVSCFTMGLERRGLQCRIQADRERLDTAPARE